MKILWVKANKILPVQSGGDIRSYNIVRQLALRHEVTFLSYYDGAPDADYERDFKNLFPNGVCIATGKTNATGVRRGVDYVLGYFQAAAPYAVSRFACEPVRKKLRRWYSERAFDVVVADFLDASVNLPELTITTVLFQHNVESEIWRRYAVTSQGLWRLLYRAEFAKMLHYEQEMVRKFHHVVAVSENDRRLMSAWTDASRITVVPTGVDLEKFRPERSTSEPAPLVMFVGAMDWEPNIDAVEYFCVEIWPSVLGQIPDARFRIVGRNPDRRVQKLASSSVEVTGSVQSVVNHLREACVVVVPLRIGGGTRLKIYEAMAMGKSVVSTSVGAEGLDVHGGRDIMLADTASQFSQAVLMLLRDASVRSGYERAGREVAFHYGWPAIANKFSEALEIAVETDFSDRENPEALNPMAVR